MPNQIGGLQGLAGINAIQQEDTFASPEERYGGTVDPFHSQVGETAKPYSWQSLQTPGATHGPYGPENQLLDDEFWFMEPSGIPSQDPTFDYNTPSNTRSHGSVNNNVPEEILSQYDSINYEVAQMGNHASNMGTARNMYQVDQLEAKQDNWNEIWEINPGSDDVPPHGRQYSHQVAGFGNNDHTNNMSAKRNSFGLDSSHMHRRYAMSSIPGNYMWLRPQGRPLYKTMAGPARPPIGAQSQFAGQDIGFAFSYDTGATLQDIPTQYVPPPSPNVEMQTPSYANPMGTDSIDLW
jgi:hypothetical protein